MRRWQRVFWIALAMVGVAFLGAAGLVIRGFRATVEPSALETVVARAMRHWSIPLSAQRERSPIERDATNLLAGRDRFIAACASCHGNNGDGETVLGRSLYPRVPDLRAAATQRLTDGELHYIIENGVQLTGMPAWSASHRSSAGDSWKLVLFIRSLGALTPPERSAQAQAVQAAHYVGSAACAKCHATLYERWKKTPMANVVRDPREHPDAIIPDLKTNPFGRFSTEQVALVYGSIWKQRYLTKIGDSYYPLPAQWDIRNHVWRPYHVARGTDWWTAYYPDDNLQRPTGTTCDGCHSVGYDIRTKQVAEWNVGCERCHGPGSAHVANPVRSTIVNPAHMDYVGASNSCIQCHSEGRPRTNPINGAYYAWPVGYNTSNKLQGFWTLEEHSLGEVGSMYYPDGTARKNRMQGNDFVQSLMYRRGVTCFSCHDVHGTDNYAQLRKPVNKLCLDCHGPLSPNGPRTATLAEHTHHRDGSTGSQCVACHMPQIETEGMPGTNVRAHTFRFITPAMTDKYKIPNPCTSCHAGKSTAWATDAMAGWPERSPWPTE